MQRRKYYSAAGTTFLAICVTVGSVSFGAETWSQPQRITPLDHEAKDAGLAGATSGGFHFSYRNAKNSNLFYVRYTRDVGLGPARLVHQGNFVANTRVAEALNQDIWVCWENWIDGPNGYASVSRDGGATWTEYNVTGYASNAGVKHPWITPLGLGTSPNMLFSAYDTKDQVMIFNVWDGTRWIGRQSFTGSIPSTEYWVTGGAHSPFNGRSYRQYGYSNDLRIRSYDGIAWSAETRLTFDNLFYAWADVDCDQFGRVMVVYERDQRVRAVLYDPASGWGTPEIIGQGRLSSVTAIADRPEFYATWLSLPNQDHIEGRHWANGTWDPQVDVSAGIARAFSNQTEVTSDPSGRLYCIFEYWGSGSPVFYWTACRDYEHGFQPTVTPTFTITHTPTVTLTPTPSNTPRSRTPTSTPVPVPDASLLLW